MDVARAVMTAVAIGALSCARNDGEGPEPVDPKCVIVLVNEVMGAKTMCVGTRAPLAVVPFHPDGAPADPSTVRYLSESPDVATVNAAGEVTARDIGTAVVRIGDVRSQCGLFAVRVHVIGCSDAGLDAAVDAARD